LVTPVFIQSPPTLAEAVKRGWLVKDALKRALSTAAGTALGFQLLLVAQTVLLAPVHDLSVASADWLVRSVATAMIWMVMTNTPFGRLLDTCELVVEQNFIGGCFFELTRQFTDILRKLRSEVLEKATLTVGGLVDMLAFLFSCD
jgi:hypothetical protein